MKFKIPFYYRNKPLGEREIEIPDFVQCGNFRHVADFKKVENIGPRYYAVYKCWDKKHPAARRRVNELTEEEIAKILEGGR